MATSQSQHLSQPHIIYIINKLNKETNPKKKKKLSETEIQYGHGSISSKRLILA